MNRPKILGGIALASMMLVVLTGCPSMIGNVVGSDESVDEAVDEAQQGDTVKVTGTVKEEDGEVDVSTDGVTITGGDEGATIDSKVTVDGNDVTIENITITEGLDTVPGSFRNLTLNNVTVKAWNATISGTFTCADVVQPGSSIQTAIDKSGSGDNVCVAPGTYTPQATLEINQALTLRSFGQGNNRSVINANGVDLSGGNIIPRKAILTIGASTVTIDSFVITAENDTAANAATAGIWIDARAATQDLTIANTEIREIANPTGPSQSQQAPGSPIAYGINVAGNQSVTNLQISNSTIQDIGSTSNSVRGVGLSIEDLTGAGATINGVTIANMQDATSSLTPGSSPSDVAGKAGVGLVLDNPDGSDGSDVSQSAIADITDNAFEDTLLDLVVGNASSSTDVSNLSINNNDFGDGSGIGLSTAVPDGNGGFKSGISNGPIDATSNFWGDASGADEDTDPSNGCAGGDGGGSGDVICLAGDIDASGALSSAP
ncbi:MAG: hypothetical protein ABEK03_04690 [Candidatus Bipolaricaulia bacterium]